MTDAAQGEPPLEGVERRSENGDGDSAAQPFDRVAELFLALTTRWRTERGVLGVGVPRRRLAQALGDEGALHDALGELTGRLVGLGLELVEYEFGGETWMCLRSLHVAPSELDDTQQGVLGTLIMLVEQESAEPSQPQTKSTVAGKQTNVSAAKLQELLVGSGRQSYLSKGRYDDALRALEHLGYVIRKGRSLQYGPRLLIEYPPDAREAIAEQAHRLVT